MRELSFTVPPEYEGKKLLGFLRQNGLSSRLINSLKQYPDGMTRNGEHIRTIDRIHEGDKITLHIYGGESTSLPVNRELQVVYEDEDILVVNKPASLAMHESHNHQGDTLANVVSGYLLSKGKGVPFRAVGRLDKDTSGLVVCALHPYSAAKLSGKVKKTYYAIVEGTYEGSGTIDKKIYRPDPMKTLRAAGDEGDTAVTHWTALKSGGGHTLMEITLETGRTHQIRVHFSSMGTPLAGDDMYGGSRELIGRHALHCGEVRLTHPVSGESLCFKSEPPQDFCSFLLQWSVISGQ